MRHTLHLLDVLKKCYSHAPEILNLRAHFTSRVTGFAIFIVYLILSDLWGTVLFSNPGDCYMEMHFYLLQPIAAKQLEKYRKGIDR